jgi:hypothetical protein
VSMIGPPGRYTRSSSSGSWSKAETATLCVVAVWAIVVAAMLGFSSFWGIVFGVVMPPIGFVVGCFNGFSVGFGASANVFTGLLLAPTLAGILGALGGVLTCWLCRALGVRSKLGHSFFESLFSSDIFDGNAAAFVCEVIVGTIIGYVVASGFASVGIVGSSAPHLLNIAGVVFGGGPGGGGPERDVINWLWDLFFVFGILLVAGAIIGSGAGAVLGTIIGAGFSSIGVTAIIQGATQGVVSRFFALFRPQDIKSGWTKYVLAGILIGAVEGITLGAGTGALLALARLTKIIT